MLLTTDNWNGEWNWEESELNCGLIEEMCVAQK